MTFGRHTQTIKFIITTILAIVGLIVFIALDGTLLKVLQAFLVFFVVRKIANFAYHRWLAHNYITPGPVGKFFLLWSIVASCLVKPISYTIGHRMHHRYSDTDNDPHSTKLGFWNFLIGNFNSITTVRVPIKDLIKKKDIVFVDKHYYTLYLLNLVILWLIDVDLFLLSFLMLNLVMWVNISIFNYVAHGGKEGSSPVNLSLWYGVVFGYWGEQLHKNHHDYPSDANFGKTSAMNFDMAYYIGKLFFKTR